MSMPFLVFGNNKKKLFLNWNQQKAHSQSIHFNGKRDIDPFLALHLLSVSLSFSFQKCLFRFHFLSFSFAFSIRVYWRRKKLAFLEKCHKNIWSVLKPICISNLKLNRATQKCSFVKMLIFSSTMHPTLTFQTVNSIDYRIWKKCK